MGRKKKTGKEALTEFELQVMSVIWELQSATVHEVLDVLCQTEKVAYTTVSTIMRILQKKEFLRAEAEGRSHRYFPLVAKSEYQSVSLNSLIEKVFDGTPSQLVARLLGDRGLSHSELQDLKELISNSEERSDG